MPMKRKYKIPEVIEREYLRPVAEGMALAYYKKHGVDRVVIEVEADTNRKKPKDIIRIKIYQSSGKFLIDEIKITDFDEDNIQRMEEEDLD